MQKALPRGCAAGHHRRWFAPSNIEPARQSHKKHASTTCNSAAVAGVPPCTVAPVHVDLKFNRLGWSDLTVSEVCLGTMTWGEQNTMEEAHQQLSYAMECGVNFIDTAEIYPVAPRRETANRTSTYIGHWLKHQQRDKLVIASKAAGTHAAMTWVPANRTVPPGPERPIRMDGPSIIAACEAELRRLQTDYIDLFQLHWPDRYVPNFGSQQYQLSQERDYVPFEELVAAVAQLLQQGKIRHWGLSNETTFGLMSHCAAADRLGVQRPASLQNSFSLIHRSAEGEIAEAISPRHLNMALLPWSAMAGGALSGKYLDREAAPAGSRFALFSQRYARFNTPRVHAAVREYQRIAREAGVTPAQLAYGFCRSRWFIPSTIIGATSTEQLREDLLAFSAPLSADTLAAIDEVHRLHRNPSLMD